MGAGGRDEPTEALGGSVGVGLLGEQPALGVEHLNSGNQSLHEPSFLSFMVCSIVAPAMN